MQGDVAATRSTASGLPDSEQNQNIVTHSGDDDESKNHDYLSCTDEVNDAKDDDEECEMVEKTRKTVAYKDFSRIPPQPSSSRSNMFTSQLLLAKEPTFPVKLHTILSNPDFEDIIAWLPHGRSWRILQQKAFEERVIPLYFRHGRYSSFARQVNGWGFRRVTHGSDYNSYYQEMFLRGMPHLCDKMRRLTAKDVADRKKTNKHNEDEVTPDFYKISQDNPLPEIRHPVTSARAVVDEMILPNQKQQQLSGRGASMLSSSMDAIQGLPNRQRNNDLAMLLARSNPPLSFDQGLNRGAGTLLERRLAELKNMQNELLLRQQIIQHHQQQQQQQQQQQDNSLFLNRNNVAAPLLSLLNPGLPLPSSTATRNSRRIIIQQHEQFLLNNPDIARLLESINNVPGFSSQLNSFRGTTNFGGNSF